nr:hypothetical protein [uncultured Agathobaculum sp.]
MSLELLRALQPETAQKKTTTKNHPEDDPLRGLACITSNSHSID